MSHYLKLMLESSRRCASATQDAANDARNAAEEASEAANRAVEANERVKVLEAKLTAATVDPA